MFPTIDLVPKKETNVLEFLEKHPKFDGRNVLIGILDTGIDPGATGLQFMEDGVTPKLLDLVDCTGSGDVDISTTQQVTDIVSNSDTLPVVESNLSSIPSSESYYQVQVLSGSTVKLSKDWWKVPQQEPPTVKLGIKLAYELFPASVTNRVKAHRKIAFEKQLNKHIADVRAALAKWQENNVDNNISNNNSNSNKPTPEQIRVREDLQARLDALNDKEWDSDNDPGMILDCIVFHDGIDDRAVIGIVEADGHDWTFKKPLAAFHKERQYSTISTVDQYNYGVNFYDDTTVLSIVGDCTPHGTHVAAIAAAAQGERSGVAKGAQIVSIKIGDSRMGSMETGSSIARGIMTAIRLGCDVINLSYGEGSQVPNAGRIVRMAEELVWRHNIIFVSAVGNNGPALSTLNAPGGISSCIIGVAAYVSPTMMKADYSLESNTDTNDELVGTTYTWSSVGPATDGSNGVTLCAPGGAITSVSNWTMQKSMLMNGTSMASPHACGCVALLLSACKAEGIPISPPRIQRALENSSSPIPGLSTLQQGCGMLQVDKAFEHLVATKDLPSEDIHFQLSLDGHVGNPRGIYLRQEAETSSVLVFSVKVDPKFRRTDSLDNQSQNAQISFEMKFALNSTESWVSVPSHFMLMNNGRSFKVTVDPTQLPHGVHTAKVCGSDAEHPERGVVWSLPITVVRPITGQHKIEMKNLEFGATEIKRYFVAPPQGVTWMDVIIRDGRNSTDEATSRLFVLHVVQLVPHAAYRDHAHHKYVTLLPSQTNVVTMPIEEGLTCEVAVGRYWSTAGLTTADISIEFRGVTPVPQTVSMCSGDSFAMVRLHSHLNDEMISPAAKLVKWKTPVRPKGEGAITPLGERDIQPWSDKKTYQLVLTYEFTQDEKGSFTPRAPSLQDVLYESTYESQLILAYDGDKKYLGFSDAYASSISASKGTVVLKMQVRHDDPTMLEKLKDMTIWIERKLEKEIPLSVFSTREDLLVGGKRTMKKRTLRKGTCAAVFFAEPAASKLPTSCKTGDILIGNCTYASGEATLSGEGKRPNGFALSYVVGPKMEKPTADSEVAEAKDSRTAEQRLYEAVRDLKVGHLDKLTKQEKEAGKFEELYDRLQEEYPNHVPLLLSKLKYLDGHKDRMNNLETIILAADTIVGEISEEELALHFGKKLDKEDPEQVKLNKEMEKKKNYLVEALVRKAYALADSKADGAPERFMDTLSRLKSWVDIDSNGKYAALGLERDCRTGRQGAALKRINKLLSKIGKDTGGVKPMTKADLLEKRSAIFQELGYEVLYKRDRAMKVVATPSDYKLF